MSEVIDVRARPMTNDPTCFIAWGKVGRIVTDDPVNEPGRIWFDFGDTPEEAMDKVLTEITNLPKDRNGVPFEWPEDTMIGAGERLRDAVGGLGDAFKEVFSPLFRWAK